MEERRGRRDGELSDICIFKLAIQPLRNVIVHPQQNLKLKSAYDPVDVWPGRIGKICLVCVFLSHLLFRLLCSSARHHGKGRHTQLSQTEGLKLNPLKKKM